MRRLRVLAMDHFFDQDLRALEAHPGLELRRFPYQRLRNRAVRLMGRDVASGLRAYNSPALGSARGHYAAWLAREVRRLYLERAFDVIVLPSDTFFYVRTLPAAAHRLGLPVVVVQKETTISQATMDVFSREVEVEAPFVSDFMTVCSERQKAFWIRAGATAGLIEVTGQPRFDVYASRNVMPPSSRPRVLFLTYALDAYVPGAGRGKGLRTWSSLRDDTERSLLDLVRAGACDVIVKCHPQQDYRVEAVRLAAAAGTSWNHGLSIAAQDADTRELIIDADVVVGFQTTALYEAVAARRRVIYAAWGAEYERHRQGLIPFDSAPSGCISHATSPDHLRTMVTEPPASTIAECATWYEESLGCIDGHSSDRVADRLASVAAGWESTEERRALEGGRRRFALGLLARSIAAEAIWTAATPIARAGGQQLRVARRRRGAREGRHLATTALRGAEANEDPTRGEG